MGFWTLDQIFLMICGTFFSRWTILDFLVLPTENLLRPTHSSPPKDALEIQPLQTDPTLICTYCIEILPKICLSEVASVYGKNQCSSLPTALFLKEDGTRKVIIFKRLRQLASWWKNETCSLFIRENWSLFSMVDCVLLLTFGVCDPSQ